MVIATLLIVAVAVVAGGARALLRRPAVAPAVISASQTVAPRPVPSPAPAPAVVRAEEPKEVPTVAPPADAPRGTRLRRPGQRHAAAGAPSLAAPDPYADQK